MKVDIQTEWEVELRMPKHFSQALNEYFKALPILLNLCPFSEIIVTGKGRILDFMIFVKYLPKLKLNM